nr:MAG: DNA pilot protein [Microvirus sp.]
MWPALIAAGGAILGQSMANDANKQNAADARDFQANQRATAYQTTVRDLQAAGLNPMLAYGNGATQTPSAAQAAPAQNITAAATTSALQATQREQTEAQIELLRAQKAKTEAETAQIPTSTANIAQNTENLKATLPKIGEEIRMLTNSAENQRNQALTETDKRNLMNAQKEVANIEKWLKAEQITNTEAQTKLNKVMTELRGYDLAGARNLSEWETTMSTGAGSANKGAEALFRLLQTIKGVTK